MNQLNFLWTLYGSSFQTWQAGLFIFITIIMTSTGGGVKRLVIDDF